MAKISGDKWGPPTLGAPGGVVTWSLTGAGRAGLRDAFDAVGADKTVAPDFGYDVVPPISEAFALWSEVADIEFARVLDQGGALGAGRDGRIRIAFGDLDGAPDRDNTLALSYFPGEEPVNGDIAFDSADFDFYDEPQELLRVALHEIGHAIGLKHEDDALAILNPVIPDLFAPQPDDIEGARRIYGPQDGAAPVLAISGGAARLELAEAIDGLTVAGDGRGNVIAGAGGAEAIGGGAGDDRLSGGDGDDTLAGGAGDDLLRGGDGDDAALYPGAPGAFDFEFGESGSLIVTGEGRDTLSPDVERIVFDDEIFAIDALAGRLEPRDPGMTIAGGASAERLTGAEGPDTVSAGAGDDIVKTHGGDDLIELGAGADILLAGAGADTAMGGDGRDIVKGQLGADRIEAGAGDDIVLGGDDDDTIIGGAGDDTLKPGRGSDRVEAGAGDDIVAGFRGDETISGGAGADTLLGSVGDDRLEGGPGDDRLQGGPGWDVFVFSDVEFGEDRIVLDFRVGADRLDLSAIAGLEGREALSLSRIGPHTVVDLVDSHSRIVLGHVDDLIGREDEVFLF